MASAYNGSNYNYPSNSLTTGTRKTVQNPDGSVEVVDTLPKSEYYRSLRKTPGGPQHQSSSQSSLSVRESGKKKDSLSEYKASGKEETCYVLMLEGVEKAFSIDRAGFGAHLLDAVCIDLDVIETEYFGLTYRNSSDIECWLNIEKPIAKQVSSGQWKFEFHVKFYPPNIDCFKEDLTRYCLCLQVRQDIISGQIPCSFNSYVMLGAYIVQSEAGDFDVASHVGTDYIAQMPFAPQKMQTQEMLSRIVELHRLHKGQTPEMADQNFLENAKKLAMYGVHIHKAKTVRNEDVLVGVYHGGIVVYRESLRVSKFSWPKILKLSHKARNFDILARPFDGDNGDRKMVFKCSDQHAAKRLWQDCVEHHAFFRLREGDTPQKPNLLPGFGTRKYRFSGRTMQQASDNPTDRPQPRIQRVATQRKPVKAAGDDDDRKGPTTIAPVAAGEHLGGPDQYFQANEVSRPPLNPEHWQMSLADCTHQLGMDPKGRDVAAQPHAGWQGCRSNKGVKGPGHFYYEGKVVEDGLVRLGWSTNDASLELGADKEGFGFGSDLRGYGPDGQGRKMTGNRPEDHGLAVKKGDVIGCFLDLDKGLVQWSRNGKVLGTGFSIPDQLKSEPFFPAASLKEARVEFNFGDSPLAHYPKGPWVPVTRSRDDMQVPNRNAGWRMNPYDSSTAMDVGPDGQTIQSQLGQGWQGCRANKGVSGAGKYYYEASPEEAGLGRVGWSTENASLDLGTDKSGFGYGADKDGFGISGNQGKKLFNDDIDNYGEAFTKGDVIGCFIDLDDGTIKWSKNGVPIGPGYTIPAELLDKDSFFPTASLNNSTMSFNFGDKPFKFDPGNEYVPLFSAADGNTKQSRKRGPERKIKGWSYIDPSSLADEIKNKRLSLHHGRHSMERAEDDFADAPNVGGIKPKPRTNAGAPRDQSMRLSASARPEQQQERISISVDQQQLQQQRKSVPPPEATEEGPASSAAPRSMMNVTNSERTTVERGEPEVETEQYYDEFGNLVTRTVKKTKIVTKKVVNQTITERSENEFSSDGSNKFVRMQLSAADIDADLALEAAILSVTGLDPHKGVVDNTLGGVEIRAQKEAEV